MIDLINEKVKLREFEFQDWSAIQKEYAADPQVTEFMPWGPNNEQATKDFLRTTIDEGKEKPRSNFQFAIIVSDRLIGGCGLRIVHHQFKTAEIGYTLGRSHWGKGYAVAAVQLLFHIAFKDLSLHRVCATCDALNLRSERVMQKVGMRKEGHFLKDRFIKDRWRDTCMYSILENEWHQTNSIGSI
jgi:ribosomal-protein-alanine N-acetyltransferase